MNPASTSFYNVIVARRKGAMAPQYFPNRRISGNLNASSENFRTLAAGENKGFEFYRKIIELGPPTLQLPRRPSNQETTDEI